MKNYELVFLASPDLTELETEEIKQRFVSFIQKEAGLAQLTSKTTAKKLGYPIKNKAVAFLISIEFSLDPKKISAFRKLIKEEKGILRETILTKKSTGSKEKGAEKTNPPADPESKKVALEKMDKKIDEILLQ